MEEGISRRGFLGWTAWTALAAKSLPRKITRTTARGNRKPLRTGFQVPSGVSPPPVTRQCR